MDNDCLFCKIIKGEVPSSKVYEDDFVYAFKDINPAAPIHILIVPKKHIDCLANISDEDEEYIWEILDKRLCIYTIICLLVKSLEIR